MKRAFLIVLDSFGIGATKDAHRFGDVGANTFGNIAKFCFLNKANNYGRKGLLYIPHLLSLGLAKVAIASSGQDLLGIQDTNNVIGSYAYSNEISSGKDTSSGHWEIAGAPVLFDWDYFSSSLNSVPKYLIQDIVDQCNLSGFLGNCHASGTDILDRFGEIHISTKKPILYTSIDSVCQIACHESIFGLKRLYNLCRSIRKIFDKRKINIARIIARPFTGFKKEHFRRTGNRRDFSMEPHKITVMEKLIGEKKGRVIAIGKISDIYAGKGISCSMYATGLVNLFNTTIQEIKNAKNNTIVFVNFVDFDSLWGHRRDVSGYAKDLEWFDYNLPKLLKLVHNEDLLIITADHGCDPTWIGTDHTRENVPILIYQRSMESKNFGYRETFSDIGQTLAKYFNLSTMSYGTSIF
ncbi:phosphopentomutase [Buchnera aphidicola str. Bp (Baizongia pistaciae)]|uniref:Phosphopentomutase n=1 Tax=Buchnera aphidicola subsp. Baizongia pistaciae (strain Bp) TaxID=224915 RepID=DEOB_BUCBP|nr:phosphopentomutase [Buchnera aphidicola]Q89A57.1 RecName: Full=Phosphopentomutase; AltName: Full=Phosphodeoxyribomutase [Buchnera aphidicola str. Bp (Baizongia pistaciae)]AAO27189.1 phosphopentomutase [Buchnera aphidicola str. Bp (Baizongia pistaciae)]